MIPKSRVLILLQNIEQWWCDVCHCSISGGDTNLLSHQVSKAHKTKVEEFNRKKPTTITNFFGPPLKSQPLTSVPTLATNISSSQTQPGTKTTVIDVDESTLEPGPPDSPKVHNMTQATLLSCLHLLTANPPQSVPIGNQDEPFACFAENPGDLVFLGQDAWEDVIGYGKSTPKIAVLIRCGPYRMDAFCNCTTACIEHLNISVTLLEMRLDCVIQAMIHLCVIKSF
jgi:hypothetical protein